MAVELSSSQSCRNSKIAGVRWMNQLLEILLMTKLHFDPSLICGISTQVETNTKKSQTLFF